MTRGARVEGWRWSPGWVLPSKPASHSASSGTRAGAGGSRTWR
jgi:hypothetical protein